MNPVNAARNSIIEKFVMTWHLSVEERRTVGVIAGTEIVEAVREIIRSQGRYPPHFSPEADFQGTLVYRTDTGYTVVTKTEIGFQRFAVVEEKSFADIGQAILCAASKIFPSGFDGIEIKW